MVSILTPSYRYGRFLGDALESVRQQASVEVEHIVQDGGSDDDTVSILRGFRGALDWRSEPDAGQSDALNRALARATGEWIAWLNADEFYMLDGLAMLLDTAARTGADVVFGDCVFVDIEGRFLRLVPQHRFSRLVLRLYGPFVGSCSVVIRRRLLPDSPWPTALRRIMDWDVYLRLLSQGARFMHVPYPVGAFRVHPDRATAASADAFRSEYSLVTQRYRLALHAPGPRRMGWAAHGLLKALDGAYRRQLRSRRFRGADLRWFASPSALRNVERLIAGCYGDRGRT